MPVTDPAYLWISKHLRKHELPNWVKKKKSGDMKKGGLELTSFPKNIKEHQKPSLG